MQETQRVMLERNIQMQNQMRERMMAQQIARTREMFSWLVSFYVVAGVAMIRGELNHTGQKSTFHPKDILLILGF